jgi:hypothetical protein
MTIRAYVNKILKEQGQKPLTKKTNLISNRYLKLAFESVSEQVLQLKKDKILSKNEAVILLLAIDRAIEYGPLLDKTDDFDQNILKAKEILKGGRTKHNLSEAMDVVLEREKSTRHGKTDWIRKADDYSFLTKNREPPLKPKAAIKELTLRYSQSEPALLRGLKRFKKNTRIQFYKDALTTLPWSDEFDEDEY